MIEILGMWFPEFSPDQLIDGFEQRGAAEEFESGLAHSLVSGDNEKVEQAQILEEAANQGLSAFNPDVTFEQLVSNYEFAETVYGPKLLRLLTGEDPNALKKNLRFPEFRRKLKASMQQKLQDLRKDGLINRSFELTERGYDLAAMSLYIDELHVLEAKGLGERLHKERSHYGARQDVRQYRKGDRYSDLALRKSVRLAIRRGHKTLAFEDLSVFERQSKGEVSVVLALDASGSMKGKKLAACKKAGVALAYKAIDNRDKAGLLVFGKDVTDAVAPTVDFTLFLRKIVKIKARAQTDLAGTIRRAISLFSEEQMTKHLILITDAVPTVGDDPEKETLRLVAEAAAHGITGSVIAIGAEEEHTVFARQMVEIGGGRLGLVSDLENLDALILEEYAAL